MQNGEMCHARRYSVPHMWQDIWTNKWSTSNIDTLLLRRGWERILLTEFISTSSIWKSEIICTMICPYLQNPKVILLEKRWCEVHIIIFVQSDNVQAARGRRMWIGHIHDIVLDLPGRSHNTENPIKSVGSCAQAKITARALDGPKNNNSRGYKDSVDRHGRATWSCDRCLALVGIIFGDWQTKGPQHIP